MIEEQKKMIEQLNNWIYQKTFFIDFFFIWNIIDRIVF